MTTVIEHHGRFTLDYTKVASKAVKDKWDGYDEQNDADAVLFHLNSLNNTFKKGIQQIVTEADTFAVIWITIMRKCNQNSLEYFKKLEAKIKITSPLSFEGQNIDLWAQAVRTNVILLMNSGQYDH